MKYPFFNNNDTEVVETRDNEDMQIIRRRRECPKCTKRFTTYERIERVPLIVMKKDGRKEQFDRDKLKNGILKSCEKKIDKIAYIRFASVFRRFVDVEDFEKELQKLL